MKKIKKFRKNNEFRDKGDAIFITILVSLMFILSVTALVVDISKNVVLKNNQTSIAQASAQVAVKDINARGSLTANSYETFLTEYLSQTGNPPMANGCSLKVPRTLGDQMDASGNPRNGYLYDGEYTGPYFKIVLSKTRGEKDNPFPVNPSDDKTYLYGTAASIKAKLPTLETDLKRLNTVYRVFNVEIYEAVPNFMLGMAGMPCQQLAIKVDAVAFGNQEDLK